SVNLRLTTSPTLGLILSTAMDSPRSTAGSAGVLSAAPLVVTVSVVVVVVVVFVPPVLVTTTGSADVVSGEVWAVTVGSVAVGSEPVTTAGTSRPSSDSRRSRRPAKRLVDMRLAPLGTRMRAGRDPRKPLGLFIGRPGGPNVGKLPCGAVVRD